MACSSCIQRDRACIVSRDVVSSAVLATMSGPEHRMVSNSWIVSGLGRSQCGFRVQWLSLSGEPFFGTRARINYHSYCGYFRQVNCVFEELRKLSEWFRRCLKGFKTNFRLSASHRNSTVSFSICLTQFLLAVACYVMIV